MVVLTKSAKNGGHCVAGIDVDTGNWVRLVSNDLNTHGALSDQDMQYQDRSYCTPLDIVSVPIIKACPSQYQPENILIDHYGKDLVECRFKTCWSCIRRKYMIAY